MSNLDKIITYINSMDPIGREAIIMELKNIYAIYRLWADDPEEFHKKHSVQEFYNMEDDFKSKLKNLTGFKTVPRWQFIYSDLFC